MTLSVLPAALLLVSGCGGPSPGEMTEGSEFGLRQELATDIELAVDGELAPDSELETGNEIESLDTTPGDALLAARTAYYVDSRTGQNSNDGKSPSKAWKTLAKVNSTTFQPGDRILLKSGAVWNERLALKGSGRSGSPIVLGSYGGQSRPIINGGGRQGAPTVLLKNVQYWEINNLEVTNTNGSSGYQGDLWGIRVNATTGGTFRHIYIRNCYVHDVNGKVATKKTGGIYVTVSSPRSSPASYSDVKILNNRVSNVGGLGIATQSTHGSIKRPGRRPFRDVLIQDNIVGPTGRNNVIIRVSDKAVVQYNRLIDSSIHDKGHSIFNFNTTNLKVQYNEAYGNVGAPSQIDRGGFDADYNSRDTYYQYNYSHDNNWAFGIMKRAINDNVVIRYNITQNDKLALYFYGFERDRGLNRADIYNNTHYVSSRLSNVRVFKNRTAFNSHFRNNIFYFAGSGSWGPKKPVGCTFRNNLFFGLSPRGTNNVVADPQLVGAGSGGRNIDWSKYPNVLTGYKLRAGSPAINAGVSIRNNGGKDFWGNRLYKGRPDIGAHEF